MNHQVLKNLIKTSFLLLSISILTNCSNSGNKSTGSSCRNQCLVNQTLCYLATGQTSVSARDSMTNACHLITALCLSDCGSISSSGTRRTSTGSTRSSGGGGRRSGGGSSGGGSSGGGNSGGGGGHGGGGH
ncbi:MAG: hypothetical protein O9264_10260 [Leptospira sp.]|nr:hypothetical protein [Leptospira sp.]